MFSKVGLALRRTGWCQNKCTSSTGNLPRKRHDITEQLLKNTYKNVCSRLKFKTILAKIRKIFLNEKITIEQS